MPNAKLCRGCGLEKPTSEFGERPGVGDGFRPRCKECVRAYSKAHYRSNRETHLVKSAARYAANKPVRNAQQRAWYAANRDQQAEQQRARAAENPGQRASLVRAWRAANPERDRENTRAWREQNRDGLRAAGRAAYRRNPEKFIERAARRRAAIAGTAAEPVDVAALWTGFCGICSGEMDRELRYPDPQSKSIDHIIPLSRGGGHVAGNLQWAHLVCNVSKGARLDTRGVAI